MPTYRNACWWNRITFIGTASPPTATFNLCRAHKITFHIFIIGGMVPAWLKLAGFVSWKWLPVRKYTRAKKVTDNLTISNEGLGNESI